MRTSGHLLLAGIVAVLVVTAGCIGVLTGSEPAVFQASEAGVSQEALSSTDFQLADQQSPWVNQTVTVAGQDRDVRVQSHVTRYEIPPQVSVTGGVTYGQFAVASTPQASVAGQAFNPVGDMSYREMLQRFSGDSGSLQDVERVDSRELTVLGSSTEVVRFSGTATYQGQEVPVYVEVTRVQDDGDFVVAVGGYPQEAEDVRPQVRTMFESIQH